MMAASQRSRIVATEAETDILQTTLVDVDVGVGVAVVPPPTEQPQSESQLEEQPPKKRGGIMKVRTLDESLKGSTIGKSSSSHHHVVYPHNEQEHTQHEHEQDQDHEDSYTVLTGPSINSHKGLMKDEDEEMMQVSSSSKGIQFDSCIVREYDIAVGDNPSVRNGAPLSLGWKYNNSGSFSVEEYETVRPSKDRRVSGELVMPRHVRERMMIEWGHSRADMRDAVRDVNTTKHLRLKTVNNLSWARLEEVIESLRRNFKKLLNPKARRAEKKAMEEVLKTSKQWSEDYINGSLAISEEERRAEANRFIREENEAAASAMHGRVYQS